MRYISLILAALLVFSGVALAASVTHDRPSPSNANTIYIDGHGEIDQPPCYVKRVRYGRVNLVGGAITTLDPKLTSGDCVMWDTTSADGVTVSACVATTNAVCGVLVTDLLTQDSGTFDKDDNMGWMCVGGYCLAKVDTSEATAGQALCVSEGIDAGTAALGTQDNYATVTYISKDVGTLLSDTGVNGLMPVWLNLN